MFQLVSLLLLLLGTEACMRSKDAERDRSKPFVKLSCPNDISRRAESRSTAAPVTWDREDFQLDSSHPIKGIYQTVPVYGASSSVHRSFQEGRHFIEYKAVDEAGNFDSCSFYVNVEVIRCVTPHTPKFGMLTCDATNLYGSRCSVGCITGYSVVGVGSIQCSGDGRWSHDAPFCRTTTCPDPGTPLHGRRFCTTDTHAFGSVCTFTCQRGYRRLGNQQLICSSLDGVTQWSGEPPTCKEIQPPAVEICPEDMNLKSGHRIREVEKPRVLFRTAAEKEAPHTCTHFGSQSSHNFTLGTHSVICTAYDPDFGSDARATCRFEISIKANPCRPLQQPLNGVLLCSRTHGGGSSTHDTSCQLRCYRGFSLPRNDGEDTEAFLCDDTGTWQPSSHVPSCVKPKRPDELKLPAEILYQTSGCTDLADVRSKFRSSLQSVIRQEETCQLSPGDCLVESVTTVCPINGLYRRFRRRYLSHRSQQGRAASWGRTERDSSNSQRLSIQFHLATRIPETGGSWPDEFHKASQRLYKMFEYFDSKVLDDQFNLGDKVTVLELEEDKESLTLTKKIAICDISYTFREDILMCVPCGAGTFYSLDRDRCEVCPLGTYQDLQAQLRCRNCKDGTTTLEVAATNESQCVDIDECESSPCANQGQCLDGPASYTCLCMAGYSGPTCNERIYDCTVHSCQHGGKCIPLDEDNYTCQCIGSYFGNFCQFQSVDGGWSDWGSWSSCSKSCEGGVQIRNRTCNSPKPSEGGHTCGGASVMETVCNIHTCPKCKRLRRPYQGKIECEKDEDADLDSCRISCRQGYAFSGPVFTVYVCGRNTSYLWPHESPDNPRCILPACTKITQAEEANYEFQSSLPVTCTDGDTRRAIVREVHKRAVELTSNLECVTDESCQVNEPVVSGCDGRVRRSAEPPHVGVSVSVTYVPRQTKHVDMKRSSEYALQDTRTSREMVTLGEVLLDKAEHGELYLILNGNKVSVDVNQTQTTNNLLCPAGLTQAPTDLFCVECSPGSFYVAEERFCSLCDVGTYQPEPAKLSCLPCPHGQTTYGRGAAFSIECYKNGTEPPSIPEDYREKVLRSSSPSWHVILPVTLVCLLCLAAVILGVYCCKRRRRHVKYNVRKTPSDEAIGKQTPEEVMLHPPSQDT